MLSAPTLRYMRLNRGFVFLLLCVGLVSGIALDSQPSVGIQEPSTSDYKITVEGSVDVPERAASFGNASYNVSSVGRQTIGDPINVSIAGPENDSYAAVLVDPNGTSPDVEKHLTLARGDSQLSFNTSELSPGTYFVAVKNRSGIRALQPVVVTGSEVSLFGPNCVEAGENASFHVTKIEGQGENVSRVELVAFDQNRMIRTTAERERANLYRAELPLEDVPPTDLLVYAAVYTGNETGDAARLRNLVRITQQINLFVVEDEASCG